MKEAGVQFIGRDKPPKWQFGVGLGRGRLLLGIVKEVPSSVQIYRHRVHERHLRWIRPLFGLALVSAAFCHERVGGYLSKPGIESTLPLCLQCLRRVS